MRFALLGNHPDGLHFAIAVAASGRHEIVSVSSPSIGPELLALFGERVALVGDLEEVLADPAVESVIVASGSANRAAHLRRALQSERDVVCIHPLDSSPDPAYEAAMIRRDTGRALLPLLHEGLHPGFLRLAALHQSGEARLGSLMLVEMEIHGQGTVLVVAGMREDRPSLPGWHCLRTLGGEVAEVSALAFAEGAAADQPLLVVGRFEKCGMFRAQFLPHLPAPRVRITVLGAEGQAELLFPVGEPGPAFLTWHDQHGQSCEESWDPWDPWPALLTLFEKAVARPAKADADKKPPALGEVTWQDAVRCLELDDAARRSVEKRRVGCMEYQEASEEVGFKGTMTLVGCGLVWLILMILFVSLWFPMIRWAIVPVLIIFLALQLFRWIIPRGAKQNVVTKEESEHNHRGTEAQR
jgi:predicted dehydrogenase